MDFTSDTETIIKLQSLNNTISHLEKTYQALLTDAKNIADKQEKNLTKIEKIEQLDQLIQEIGGYEQLEDLLIEIKEIVPFLKQLQTDKQEINESIHTGKSQIQEYRELEKNLANKLELTTENLTMIDDKIEQLGGFEALAQMLKKVDQTQIYLEQSAEELAKKISQKIKNELNEFAQELKEEMAISFKPQNPSNLTEIAHEEGTSVYNLELTWENIIAKEPLAGIIKKYAETYRIEKLYTANMGQLVYGIKRTTIRIIIIMQNMRGKSIILRDEDKRKELNLTAQEANFIYEYIESYLQPMN